MGSRWSVGPQSRANSHNRDLGGGDVGLWTLPRTRQRHAGVTEGILRPAADRTPAPEAHPDLELEGPRGLGICGSQAGMARTSKAASSLC